MIQADTIVFLMDRLEKDDFLAAYRMIYNDWLDSLEHYGVRLQAHVNRDNERAAALPTRAVRTKKYGPAQDPRSYVSATKLRAYAYGAEFIEGPPTARLPSGEWRAIVADVFERDRYTCTYCGGGGHEYQMHCDHIAPVSRGGPNVIENLTAACDYCNASKRDRLPHEWMPLQDPTR